MTIVALRPEHFDILENESVSAWLTFSGAIAPGASFLLHFSSLFRRVSKNLLLGHGMANWRLKTGSAVQAALQNLSSIINDPSSFTLSPEQLLALTSPEEQPRLRDEFDFSDDDAVLVPSREAKEKRKKKRKSDSDRVERRTRDVESRHRNELWSEEERLQHVSAANSDDEPVVSRLQEPVIASLASSASPPREQVRRKRVVTAAGSSDSEGDSGFGSKQLAEPTPVTEVRKRRPVVLSDDDE
jgi:hypothetical protein